MSQLAFADGFAWGWAQGPIADATEVHLYADGRHVATELAGAVLPERFYSICGTPPQDSLGFVFALPATLLDGFAHDLHVGLPFAQQGGLHGEVQTFCSSAVGQSVRGVVAQQGKQFVGTVWFEKLPRKKAVLQVTDADGNTVHSQPLAVERLADEHGYPAGFTVPCNGLPPGLLNFTCQGQALRGSPCARALQLVGLLNNVQDGRIKGWALDGADWANPIELVLRLDGQACSWFRPNIRRPDISQYLGLPDDGLGLTGFDVPTPPALADGRPHVVEVVSAANGQLLKNGRQQVMLAPAGLHWLGRRWADPPIQPAQAQTQKHREKLKRTTHSAPAVSVIILNRNGAAVLAAFLQSWQLHNTSVVAEIIVVDHASVDGSRALLNQWQDRLDLSVLALDHNGSFSESCNLGARHARGQHLLFMNNDIVWLQDALPRMLESLQNPQVGVVGIKLLKAVGAALDGVPIVSEVQHLGVRFKLNDKSYWPFEVSPSDAYGEAEHTPQYVPAVTGAVLLCRATDFADVGGFDPAYFYGFEDVELCLRLAYRLRKAVICRNDCVALHRHGHTRLSGREITIFDRVMRNSAVLESHIGVWIKQAYWRSLVCGDGYVTREPLTIGLVVDAEPQHTGNTPLVTDVLALCQRIRTALPHARLVLLPPALDWKNADGLHVLLVGDTRFDIRTLRKARPDLLTVAWLRSGAVDWPQLPWWGGFGALLAPQTNALVLTKTLGLLVQASSVAAPLGDTLCTNHWRLRVAVLARAGANAQAVAVQQSLRAQGLPCWLVADDNMQLLPMVDVCITIGGPAGTVEDTTRAPLGAGVLHVAWPADSVRLPDAAWLAQQMEMCVGNTFYSS